MHFIHIGLLLLLVAPTVRSQADPENCVWHTALKKLVEGTVTSPDPYNTQLSGAKRVGYSQPIACGNSNNVTSCQQMCLRIPECNHFVRNRQSYQTVFYNIDSDANRHYVTGTIGNTVYDSYDHSCGRSVAYPPYLKHYFREKCNANPSSCQPSYQRQQQASHQRKLLYQLLDGSKSAINRTFNTVKDAKKAMWTWIGFPEMHILDNGLVNGDEIFNYAQAYGMFTFYDSEPGEERRKRSLLVDFTNNNKGDKWPTTTIKYKIDVTTGFQSSQIQTIRTALNWFDSSRTCIRFVEDATATQDVVVLKHGSTGVGCSGTVGKQRNGQLNYIILEDSCLQTPNNQPLYGVVAHEALHNLGVRHEHQRPDRDTFISFVLENIDPVLLDEEQALADQNFQTDVQTSYYSTSYDYQSVMHYPNRAAARQNLPTGHFTILTAQQTLQNIIGQRTQLSNTDLKAINRAYGCTKDCTYTQWSQFGPCNQGQRSRTRSIAQQAMYGGLPCSRQLLKDSQNC